MNTTLFSSWIQYLECTVLALPDIGFRIDLTLTNIEITHTIIRKTKTPSTNQSQPSKLCGRSVAPCQYKITRLPSLTNPFPRPPIPNSFTINPLVRQSHYVHFKVRFKFQWKIKPRHSSQPSIKPTSIYGKEVYERRCWVVGQIGTT